MKKVNMRKKIYFVILITTGILFVLFFTFFSNLMFKSEYQSYAHTAEIRVDNMTYNINRIFYSAIDRSNNISNNMLLLDIVTGEDYSVYFMDELDFLKKFFSSFTEYENYISGQYHIYTDNEKIPENLYFSNLERLSKADSWEKLERLESSETAWIYNDVYPESLSAFTKMTDNDKTVGYLEIKIPIKQLENVLTAEIMNEKEKIVVTKEDGGVLLSSNDYEINGDSVVFSKKTIPGLTISLHTEESFIYRSCYIYISIAAIFLMLFLVLLSIFYMWLIKRLTYDFDYFVQTLEKDENILLNPQFIDEEADGDILKIKVKFKKLIGRINDLHKEIEHINNEKKKIELATLQTSFNPHLLYNSLSVLKWRLFETDDELMMNMIDYMVEYYRSVLADGNNIITVSEELTLIEQYLQIVKISYDKDFDLKLSVDDDVKSCYTIKQILQPVVENAVMHGLSHVEDAKLEISVYKKDNMIVFEVCDNGCGMDEEVIRQLLEGVSPEKNTRRRSYGIRNTVNRIKTYYGNDYGIFIDSIVGQGTKVILTTEYLDKNSLSERIRGEK